MFHSVTVCIIVIICVDLSVLDFRIQIFFPFFRKCPKKKFLTILLCLNDSYFNDNYDNEDHLCIAISINETYPGVFFIFFDGCAFLIYPSKKTIKKLIFEFYIISFSKNLLNFFKIFQ
jgi:hypothetical protein